MRTIILNQVLQMKNYLTSKEYWEKREAYKLKKGLKDLKKIEKELVEE